MGGLCLRLAFPKEEYGNKNMDIGGFYSKTDLGTRSEGSGVRQGRRKKG